MLKNKIQATSNKQQATSNKRQGNAGTLGTNETIGVKR
jgi:hypothetical protein